MPEQENKIKYKPTIKKQIMVLLGDVDEVQVEMIIAIVGKQLYGRIVQLVPETIGIPEELEYIVVELAIARFNRIGSEGMRTETVEGHSATYTRSLADYEQDLLAWADTFGYERGRRGKVRAF